MKINRSSAIRLWEERYGNCQFARDFHGNLMCKMGYGNERFYIMNCGVKIFCGWDLHHVLPISHGGTNRKTNLICTNIETNRLAEDKITFWIDDCLYQVKRVLGTEGYGIYKIN